MITVNWRQGRVQELPQVTHLEHADTVTLDPLRRWKPQYSFTSSPRVMEWTMACTRGELRMWGVSGARKAVKLPFMRVNCACARDEKPVFMNLGI